MCALTAPEVFDQDDEEGLVMLLHPAPGTSRTETPAPRTGGGLSRVRAVRQAARPSGSAHSRASVSLKNASALHSPVLSGELIGEHAHHDEIVVPPGEEHMLAETPLLDETESTLKCQ